MSIPTPFNPLGTLGAETLPPEYRALDYIEGTGSQCVNLGDINFSYAVGVDIEFSVDPSTASCALYGGYILSASPSRRISAFCGISGGRSKIQAVNDMLRQDYDAIEHTWLASDKVRIMHNYLGTRTGYIKINNITAYIFGGLTGEIDTHIKAPFCLLSRYITVYGFESCLPAKIYRARVSDGNNVWRDLRPALRTSDSKPGMYDLVGGNFYTNARTGEFLYA